MSAGFLADAVLLTHRGVRRLGGLRGPGGVALAPDSAAAPASAGVGTGSGLRAVCPLAGGVIAGRQANETGGCDHYVGGSFIPQGQWTAAGLLGAVNVVAYGALVVRTIRRRGGRRGPDGLPDCYRHETFVRFAACTGRRSGGLLGMAR